LVAFIQADTNSRICISSLSMMCLV